MASAVRQNVVAPLGLMTTPNPYGQYPPGALSQADGVSMRAPGELRTLPMPSAKTFTGIGSTDIMWKMAPLDAGHIYSFTTDVSGLTWNVKEGVIGGSQTTVTLPTLFGGTQSLFTPGRICPVRSRDRMLVNGRPGVLVCDVMAPASPSDRALRFAGMAQPAISVSFQSQTDGPIPIQIMVAYCAILVRKFADGYSLKSVPSPAASVYNGGANPAQFVVNVSFDFASAAVGDIVELYRTDGLSTNSSFTDPGPTFKLIQSVTLSSTDISNRFVNIIDNATCASPFFTTAGRELYTNPGQEGALGANRQPDPCGACAVFKGYTFYGNLTERPQFIASAPAGFTQTSNASSAFLKTNHIGYRLGAGTVTSGSAVITAIPAGGTLGVVPGQQWAILTAYWPVGTKVLSVTSTTITMASNAAASSTTDGWVLTDALEVNGIVYPISSYGSMASQSAQFELTYSATINNTDITFNKGDTFIIEPIRYASALGANLTIRATNGANYSPPIPEINQTVQTIAAKNTPNLMRWSKNSEPEHVPASNETRVGSGRIISFVSTKDALWIFCTDGVFRLSGDAGVWRIDVIDPKCILCAPQCATSLHETVYAYTNYGFVSITSSGIKPISLNRVTELLPGSAFAEVGDMIVDRDPTNHEVLISLNSTSNILYVYNTPNDAFTRIANDSAFNNVAAIAFQDSPASGAPSVVLGFSSTSGPAMSTWNDTTQWTAANVQYRSVYGDDPASQKQWINATYIFNSNDVGKNIQTTVSGNSSGATALRTSFNDAYGTCGIVRNYAIAPSIVPGWQQASHESTQTEFRGVSLYLVEYTQQPWRQK